MVRRELWEAIRRVAEDEHLSVSALARCFEVGRKTIRRCLRATAWQPYQHAAREATLLAEHAAFLTARASELRYSARILYQDRTGRYGFHGSYATVRRGRSARRGSRASSTGARAGCAFARGR